MRSSRLYTVDVPAREHVSVGRQALRREVNERAAGSTAAGAPTLSVLCECGLTSCAQRFAAARETYAAVRRFPTRFLVARAHVGG